MPTMASIIIEKITGIDAGSEAISFEERAPILSVSYADVE